MVEIFVWPNGWNDQIWQNGWVLVYELSGSGLSPVAVTSPSDFAAALSKEVLDIQATI